jgi:hypothetical protein
MQEFDKFMQNELLNLIQETNQNTDTPKNEINADYEKYRARARKAKLKLHEFHTKYNSNLKDLMLRKFMEFISNSKFSKQIIQNNPQINDAFKKAYSPKNQEEFRKVLFKNISEETQEILKQEYESNLIDLYKQNRSIYKKTNYKDPKKLEKKITYVRYADDWIIFVRGTKEDAIKARELAAKFLIEKLGLT